MVKIINNDTHFQSELASSLTKLIVANFTAQWCKRCQKIAPIFQQFADKYTNAIFLKVDVDQCQETASSQGVNELPAFIFYREMVSIDKLDGNVRPALLEDKILQYYSNQKEKDAFIDLLPFITKAQCECLNESTFNPLSNCLQETGGFLQSDFDEQLLIYITFSQTVRIDSVMFKAPMDKGPKSIRIFVNLTKKLNFDNANNVASVQDLDIGKDLLAGKPIKLQNPKFQSVHNMQVYVKDNQVSGEVTRIDHFAIIGLPTIIPTTPSTARMSSLRRFKKDGKV